MDNTSLDDFIGEDSEDESATDEPAADEPSTDESATGEPSTDEPAVDESITDETAADTEAVEPAISTYGWTPDGVECAACGAVVERRWHEDGEMVCADCKTW